MKKLTIFLMFVLLLTLFAGCREEPVASTAPTTTASQTGATTTAPTTAPETTAAAPETVENPEITIPSPETTAAPTSTEPAPMSAEDIHPMLFHVTGENGQEMYLFGTIHVGDERIETALDKLTHYLDDCDALAVEFDVVGYEEKLMSDMELQIAYYTPYILNEGTDITDYMSVDTYRKASALLRKAGLMPSLMKRYNLAMWSQLVEQAAIMTKSDLNMEIGMDRALIRHCYDKQIEVRDVESADFQTSLLAGFSDELNLLMIENTLKNLENYGAQVDEIYFAWLGGDYDNIVEVLNSEMAGGEEDLTEDQAALMEDYNDKMLTQRNLGMRDKALEWLKAGDKVFFAVGAAHLVDEGGLVELLRAAGYSVEQESYG